MSNNYFFLRFGSRCIYVGPADIFSRDYTAYLANYENASAIESTKEEIDNEV